MKSRDHPNCSVQNPYSLLPQALSEPHKRLGCLAASCRFLSTRCAFQARIVSSEFPWPFHCAECERTTPHPVAVSARRIGHERSCVFQIHQMNFMDDDVCSERIGPADRWMGSRPGLGCALDRLRASLRLGLRRPVARPGIRKSLFAPPRADRSRIDGWRVRARRVVHLSLIHI